MIVTSALEHWARISNRRRAVEVSAGIAPWFAVGALASILAGMYGGPVAATLAACGSAGLLLGLAVQRMRRLRVTAPQVACSLDRSQNTVDLLETAYSMEWRGAADPVEDVVLARARDLVPTLAGVAVAPLKLRTSPLGVIAAITAALVLVLVGPPVTALADDQPVNVLGADERKQADEIGKALDALEQDESLSPEARSQMADARRALANAKGAKSATAALAALSDAARHLDAAAPQVAKDSDPSKMTNQQLADQLAKAAQQNDAARISALTKEAMRRAGASLADAQALANAMKMSAADARRNGDPWSDPSDPSDPAGRRLAQMDQAADQLRSGDVDRARALLDDLAKAAPGSSGRPGDPRQAQLDNARRALAALRAAQRSALNSGTRPGSGSGSGSGSGAGSGMAMGTGSGSGSGSGMNPGMPGNGSGVGVVVPDQFGPWGTSGLKTPGSPSGAKAPDSVAAERVDATTQISPEGVIKAIAEHAAGVHVSEQFGPVRDHYAALAEAAIRRDEIPLTRRDFIQRYFEALRNHEAAKP
jgi:uncharacterized membrane protein YgcG